MCDGGTQWWRRRRQWRLRALGARTKALEERVDGRDALELGIHAVELVVLANEERDRVSDTERLEIVVHAMLQRGRYTLERYRSRW